MRVSELLAGQWLEFSGGSRSGTNRIRFSREEDGAVFVEVFYVFDWNTGETQNLGFVIPREQFEKLVDGMFSKGEACIKVRQQEQDFSFEGKLIEGGFGFRIRGKPKVAFPNPTTFEMANFGSVECGTLEE